MKFEPQNISKNINKKEKITKLFFLFIYIILIPIILFSVFLTVLELEKNERIPKILDYEIYSVISDSMKPRLKAGDIIVLQKNIDENRLKVGNIISFKKANGEIITHRIKEIREQGQRKAFITKGDANAENDYGYVYIGDIIGRVVYTMPSQIQVLKNKVFFSCITSVIILILFINIKLSKKRLERKLDREKHEKGSIW